MGFTDKLFGKQVSPEEQAKEWRRKLRQEGREIDRNVRHINQEEAKLKKSMKQAAKKNDVTTVKILAKELVQSRNAKSRLYKAKAQMNSVQMQLQQQAAEAKVMGALQKSTQVMTMMNKLARVPEIQHTMMNMQKEMEKAGMMQDMMDESFEDMEDSDDEVEEETAVNQILDEVVGGQLDSAAVGSGDLEAKREGQGEANQEDDELNSRLSALKQ
eukprot:gb/GECH01012428.1/.p1 GENE.gb/GECH01012428.1/~~gb/GECH01012428.1/.p1  ORF type:complete len:215 (+),score=71.87 gb/GECH01012428.1/:1-645(+)